MTEEAGTHRTVTVVLATDRASRFLDEAVASVRAQTHPGVELVVVDDGSPDPRALDEAIATMDGAVVVHTEHQGVSAARNRGVATGTGDLIAFLDDDDRWHPERLARHVAAMAAHPTAVASYCGMRVIDEEGAELVPGHDVGPADARGLMRRDVTVTAPTLVVRRDAFAGAGGFDPALSQAEDLDLVLRLAPLGGFVPVPGVLVDYRHHAGNVTRNYRELTVSIRGVLRRHRRIARSHGDRSLVGALDHSLAANRRFAAWSAARAARARLAEHHPLAAAGDVAWVAGFAPGVGWDWLRHRAEVASAGHERRPR